MLETRKFMMNLSADKGGGTSVEPVESKPVDRSYENYYKLCCPAPSSYYREVVDAFEKELETKPKINFEAFDDKFFREYAGLEPNAPLKYKSNEVFDSKYALHSKMVVVLRENADIEVERVLCAFEEQIKLGNIQTYSEFCNERYAKRRQVSQI